MKKKKIRKAFFAFLLSFSVITSYAQIGNIDFLEGGIADGAKLFEAYLAPWANAFGASLNGGWYNTAKPHKLGGFDVTFSVSTTIVPASAKSFDLSEISFQNLSISGTDTEAPTIAGENKDGPTLEYILNDPTYGDITIASFKTPPGSNWGAIPLPMIQAGLGLPLGTEVTVRFIPKIKIPIIDTKVSMWGVGGKHSILQYFPGEKLMPIDLTLQGGYTKLKVSVPIELQPDASISYFNNYDINTDFEDQEVNMEVTAYSINLLLSKKIPVVTFYGGVGYSKTQTVIDVAGYYALPTFDATHSIQAPYSLLSPGPVYTDANVKQVPVIDIKNHSGLRLNAGIRFTLGVLTIHGDYTKANYSVITGGLGISFR
ncbi:MAG: hypothetical protein KAU83_07520 [Bacteroidales bacterium]|nr:hypothetical protein [Bacteroidales bacterium]